jgi:hypothetical protein
MESAKPPIDEAFKKFLRLKDFMIHMLKSDTSLCGATGTAQPLSKI